MSGKPISTVAPFRSISSWASDFTGFIVEKIINHWVLTFLTIENNLQVQVLLARQLPPLQVVLVYDVLCAILYFTTGFIFFFYDKLTFFVLLEFYLVKLPPVSYDDLLFFYNKNVFYPCVFVRSPVWMSVSNRKRPKFWTWSSSFESIVARPSFVICMPLYHLSGSNIKSLFGQFYFRVNFWFVVPWVASRLTLFLFGTPFYDLYEWLFSLSFRLQYNKYK